MAKPLKLPFLSRTLPGMISHLFPVTQSHLLPLFKEVRRVLAPKGFWLFSTLGPNTLWELNSAFATLDAYTHLTDFPDYPETLSSLTDAHFLDPVMEVDSLSIGYPSIKALLQDLQTTRFFPLPPSPKRPKHLYSAHLYQQLSQAYPPSRVTTKDHSQQFLVTLELIIGIGWG